MISFRQFCESGRQAFIRESSAFSVSYTINLYDIYLLTYDMLRQRAQYANLGTTATSDYAASDKFLGLLNDIRINVPHAEYDKMAFGLDNVQDVDKDIQSFSDDSVPAAYKDMQLVDNDLIYNVQRTANKLKEDPLFAEIVKRMTNGSAVQTLRMRIGFYDSKRARRKMALISAAGKAVNGKEYSVPLASVCLTFVNFLVMAFSPAFASKNRQVAEELDTRFLRSLINQWDDRSHNWLSRQRLKEALTPHDDRDPQSLCSDWSFLPDQESELMKVCMMSREEILSAKRAGRLKGIRPSEHLLKHKAFDVIKPYLQKRHTFGRPIIQAVKRPGSAYAGGDMRFCILTDGCLQLEWYYGHFNRIKSVSFCDPVQIVEWFAGSDNMVGYAARVGRDMIPVRLLKLALTFQKMGIGYELDHDYIIG